MNPGQIVDEAKFDAILTKLEKSRQWSPRVISKLESLIRTGDDYSLFRINPLAYAKEKVMEEREAIDLFLHASVSGLFQLNWSLLCPGCTSVVESFSNLRNLDSHYHCELCDVDLVAVMDDFVQVNFTVVPEVRNIIFNDMANLTTIDSILKFRYAREGIMKCDGSGWIEKIKPMVIFHAMLTSGETKSFSGKITEGYLLINELLNHYGASAVVTEPEVGGGRTPHVNIGNSSIEISGGSIPAGEMQIEIQNSSQKKGLVVFLNPGPEYKRSFAMTFSPFLSGKHLITSQTFRELFHFDVIKGNQMLEVKNIAILFTDLKGSTSLYERIGDLNAFSLVRQHFDILGEVVNKNSGSIVKTIGDAVMASFMNPYHAVKAAMEMRRAVKNMNSSQGDRDLILKIGVHSGTSIVVNLNERLDYFGQTVNIAARVQNLASADEIFLTGDVFSYPGIGELISGETVEYSMARVKGMQDEIGVYKISSPSPEN
jgi:class 3 adenylate cyclase